MIFNSTPLRQHPHFNNQLTINICIKFSTQYKINTDSTSGFLILKLKSMIQPEQHKAIKTKNTKNNYANNSGFSYF